MVVPHTHTRVDAQLRQLDIRVVVGAHVVGEAPLVVVWLLSCNVIKHYISWDRLRLYPVHGSNGCLVTGLVQDGQELVQVILGVGRVFYELGVLLIG